MCPVGSCHELVYLCVCVCDSVSSLENQREGYVDGAVQPFSLYSDVGRGCFVFGYWAPGVRRVSLPPRLLHTNPLVKKPRAAAARICGSVSDRHKLLLLKSPHLWPHAILGLFADQQRHPRGQHAESPVPVETQAVWQCRYAEMLQQLALFPSGREAMQKQAAVIQSLRQVRKS